MKRSRLRKGAPKKKVRLPKVLPYFVKLYWGRDPDEMQMLRVDVPLYTFSKEIEAYRKSDPENYNIDDFILWLKKHGVKVEAVSPKEELFF